MSLFVLSITYKLKLTLQLAASSGLWEKLLCVAGDVPRDGSAPAAALTYLIGPGGRNLNIRFVKSIVFPLNNVTGS